MNKLASAILIGSMAVGGVAIATADDDYREKGEYHGKYCDKDERHGSRMERMKSKLDLSESQVKKMKELKEKFKPQKQALRKEMRESRKALRELMHSGNMDKAAVNKAATKQAELVKEKILLRSQFKIEMNKVLTDEQRERMKDMRQRHGKKHYDDDDEYEHGKYWKRHHS